MTPTATSPGTTGAVLDPIFALRTRLRLGRAVRVGGVHHTRRHTRERAFELADRYHDPHAAQRALDLAWTSQQVELRELSITPADAAVFQEIAGHLLYPHPPCARRRRSCVRNRGSQPLLWTAGHLRRLADPARHHRFARRAADAAAAARGAPLLAPARHEVDLVVLQMQPSGYLQDFHDRVSATVFASSETGVIDQPGGVLLRRADQLPSDVLLMLRATARVHVPCDGRSLGGMLTRHVAGDDAGPPAADASFGVALRRAERSSPQLTRPVRPRVASHLRGTTHGEPDGRAHSRSHSAAPGVEAAPPTGTNDSPPTAALLLDNGIGGLTSDGDYEIRLRGDALPPAPWANVIANPHGGFVVTERGAGFTWAENSYFYRLTPWRNDPVSDAPGEALYLRDEDSGALWSATPAPIRHGTPWTIRHGAGTSTFEHVHDDIATQLTLGVAPDAAVKLSLLRVTNRGTRRRRIAVTAYAEWTLGVLREHTQHQVQTTFDAASRAILARNTFNEQFAEWVAFCALRTNGGAGSRSFACARPSRRSTPW
jgi:cyclic beta-1,2-glucan synthetase